MAERMFAVGDYALIASHSDARWNGVMIRVTQNQTLGSNISGVIVATNPWAQSQGYHVNFVGFTVAPQYVIFVSRKARGELMMKEAELKMTEAKRMMGEAEALLKYETDEEALADLMVTAIDMGGSKKERVSALAGLLKDRVRTDKL